MNHEFVGLDFEPPRQARIEHFVIQPLGPDDVDADCAAVNRSISLIRQTRGGKWPQGPISIAEDLGDLKEHQRQFKEREAFAYTIVDERDGSYAGCLYVYPPNHPFDDTDKSEMPADADAVVSFWVTPEVYGLGVYNSLFHGVSDWIHLSWPFQNVFISNREKPAVT